MESSGPGVDNVCWWLMPTIRPHQTQLREGEEEGGGEEGGGEEGGGI